MKTRIFVAIIVSMTLLVSAAVWEGVSDVVSGKDLPGNYSIATNAFPRNSVVDITNLENGKIVRALVVSGLETKGLLATLSRTAAESIDLRGNSTCRIRITQPADDIAFSHFKLGPIAVVTPPVSEPDVSENAISGTPNTVRPAAKEMVEGVGGTSVAALAPETEKNTGITAAKTAPEPAKEPTAVKPIEEAAGTSAGTNTEPIRTAIPVAKPVTATDTKPAPTAATQKNTPATVENPPEPGNIPGNLTIVPSEERPPYAENRYVIAPENLTPPLKTENPSSGSSSPETSDFSPFQVPLISSLEQGKCYVQVAAYQRVDHVEDEISRIGTAYPLAVQNIGSDANPMFRILLGPLNQGESGALLQRVKSIGYNDAFIRYN